ncbi:MAG: hypothetical protein AVDCRST_MAG55-1190 [uncultured Rubrobacteraceae bacterium]|uniref:Uncharacterized protein n=1 Tax=uncultured Rubrobacteraceae bacterium TaxID=349277 RepID=A0A6J4P891_9ACTN|nr:MAG: hypothetical protein AVDCRST_MAG55-1190 [uncultured Rubrobacteraceae bacterium]
MGFGSQRAGVRAGYVLEFVYTSKVYFRFSFIPSWVAWTFSVS